MLIKFETKSARVKGLSFHPKRRWLLASLHNGVIQLWDYSERTMIDKFDEHKGPVRGLDFHKHQPLFVSGGDDSKIKVWNYKSRRCLFTLDAHEDYIRTTSFHHEHPWILSCSDDQSIRIWNWQSRSRIAVLTGHTHYVLCAQFHPANELILSSSIDQTLRLWDITGLKMKNTSSSMSTRDEISTGLPEILSKTDFSVESIEAHDREVNWCSFHPDPSKQLCLSCGDDNQVKIWKIYSGNGLREVDTLKGHYNNVNCAIFHPRKDLALSASEDRSIRVWDIEKRSALCTHRKETDRIWVISAHPIENLFAAGHDSGLMLFKLERERPAFTVVKDIILFIKGKQLCRYNMKTHEKRLLVNLKPKTELSHYYHKLHCYSYDESQTNQVLVSVRSTNIEKSIYDCYRVSGSVSRMVDDTSDAFRSPGLTAIFIGPNRSAILDKSRRVIFKVNNEERKGKTTITADDIFFAGAGRLFVKSKINDSDTISLWDVERDSAMYSVKVDAKYVVMSDNKNYVACVGSNKIVICDGQLNILSTIHEQRKIKSAVWDENGVLIYSTPVHVKYALTDGDTTTIVSVQQTLYIMAVRDNKVFCIDRNGDVKQIPVDAREFKFKQAVIRNERAAILASLRQLGTLTRAEISFLVKKGHPGLALKFVKDNQTRFPLALQAYDIDEALDSATQLDNVKCWEELVEVAIQVGHIKAVETAYIKLRKPYKLAMLYLVSGQKDKMIGARSLARELGDTSTEFVISLLLKDFVECTNIIRRCGYPNLAYTCAVNHGLYELAQEISVELSEKQLMHLPALESAAENSSWMERSIPTIGNGTFNNWPMLNDEQENFEAVLADEVEEDVELEDNGDWEDDEFKSSDPPKSDQDEMVDVQEEGWDDDEPLEDLLEDDDDDDDEQQKHNDERAPTAIPNPGPSITSGWMSASDLALHHVLAGSYKSALSFLQTQIGVVDAAPLKDIFRDLVMRSRVAYQGTALHPTTFIYPTSNERIGDVLLPAGGYKIDDLEKRLADCFSLFSGGKFSDAIVNFRTLLLSTIFLQIYISDSSSTLEERSARAKEIITISKEYILGVQIWLERKNITGKEFEDHKRACELAAYFARLNLSKHRSKVLEKAFEVFLVKPKEFQKTRAAISIARRLLDYLNENDQKKEKMREYAKKVKNAPFDAQVDQKIQLDYDDLNPYSLCAATFRPIFSGNRLVSCPLCDAKYKPEFEGQVCRVCLVSEIGRSCTGIRFKATNFDED